METDSKKIKYLSMAGLLSAAVIWGFAFVIVKNSVDTVPPVYMLAFRFSIAAAGLALIFIKQLRKIRWLDVKYGVIIGFFLFFSYFFQTIGIKYTTAGKNAFLTTIYVVIVPFLHWLINKRKPSKNCIAAAFMAVTGIGLLSLNGDLTINYGDLLTIICGFGFAFHMIFIDKYTEIRSPLFLTLIQLTTAAVLGWILAPVLEGGFPVDVLQTEMWTGMLYLGIGSTMIGFLLQTVCQKYTTPNASSLLLSTESVFGIIFSVICLGEVLTVKMVVGCVLIFAAILLAEIKFPAKNGPEAKL
jgi:drug/metabolite transporter (DMT)-like permease